MKKLLALAVAGAFIGAASFTTVATPAFAAEKAKASSCEKITDAKKKDACMKKEAAAAAKKAKKDAK